MLRYLIKIIVLSEAPVYHPNLLITYTWKDILYDSITDQLLIHYLINPLGLHRFILIIYFRVCLVRKGLFVNTCFEQARDREGYSNWHWQYSSIRCAPFDIIEKHTFTTWPVQETYFCPVEPGRGLSLVLNIVKLNQSKVFVEGDCKRLWSNTIIWYIHNYTTIYYYY